MSEVTGENTSGDAEHCTVMPPLILVGGGRPHVKHWELSGDKMSNMLMTSCDKTYKHTERTQISVK